MRALHGSFKIRINNFGFGQLNFFVSSTGPAKRSSMREQCTDLRRIEGSWVRADIGGDPIVAVLTNQVSDAHLAGLRKDGASYIFAGARELDLNPGFEILNRELGIKRLDVHGGGVTNGAFLRAGLIEEISLVIFPAVDEMKGSSSSFDSGEDEIGAAVTLRSMTLASSEVLECAAAWLRHQVRNA